MFDTLWISKNIMVNLFSFITEKKILKINIFCQWTSSFVHCSYNILNIIVILAINIFWFIFDRWKCSKNLLKSEKKNCSKILRKIKYYFMLNPTQFSFSVWLNKLFCIVQHIIYNKPNSTKIVLIQHNIC